MLHISHGEFQWKLWSRLPLSSTMRLPQPSCGSRIPHLDRLISSGLRRPQLSFRASLQKLSPRSPFPLFRGVRSRWLWEVLCYNLGGSSTSASPHPKGPPLVWSPSSFLLPHGRRHRHRRRRSPVSGWPRVEGVRRWNDGESGGSLGSDCVTPHPPPAGTLSTKFIHSL